MTKARCVAADAGDAREGVRAHRRAEAAQGLALLRGCPSTFLLKRPERLDRLTGQDRINRADEVSWLAEAGLLAPAVRAALIAWLPLLTATEADLPKRPELRFQNVKNLAAGGRAGRM